MISRSALEKGWHFLGRGFLGLRARSYVQIEWVLTPIGGPVSGHWKGQKAPLSQAKECTGYDSWVLGDPTGLIRFMARTTQWKKINHLLLLPTHSVKRVGPVPRAQPASRGPKAKSLPSVFCTALPTAQGYRMAGVLVS